MDFTPEQTTSAAGRASSPRSAEMSSRSPRWTPPIPPVAMNPIPAERQAASVPPAVVAPTAPCTAQAARSRGPTLRASAVKRSSSASESPTPTAPSSTPTVAGRAPASRTRRSASNPTATPSPGGKPCATSVVSSATTGRRRRRASSISRATSIKAPPRVCVPSDKLSIASVARKTGGNRVGERESDGTQALSGGCSRHRSQLRDAPRGGLGRRRRAADEIAGCKGVARSRRVDDVGAQRRELLAVDREALFAALDDERARRWLRAERGELAFICEDGVGLEELEAAEEPLGAVRADASRRREIDAHLSALSPHGS